MVSNRTHPCSGVNIRYHDYETTGVSPCFRRIRLVRPCSACSRVGRLPYNGRPRPCPASVQIEVRRGPMMPIQADARGFRVRAGDRLGQSGMALRHVLDGQGRSHRQVVSSPSPVQSDEQAGLGHRRRFVAALPPLPDSPRQRCASIVGSRRRGFKAGRQSPLVVTGHARTDRTSTSAARYGEHCSLSFSSCRTSPAFSSDDRDV